MIVIFFISVIVVFENYTMNFQFYLLNAPTIDSHPARKVIEVENRNIINTQNISRAKCLV